MRIYLLTVLAGVLLGAGMIGAGRAWRSAGLPVAVDPCDARVMFFIAGEVDWVDEADLLRCRPHLREAAEELLGD